MNKERNMIDSKNKVIKKPKKDKIDKNISKTAQISAMSFSGPLPPPILLKEYEEVIPGAANRILESFEEEGKHRRVLEKEDLSANYKVIRRGQYLGFLMSVIFVLTGAYVVLQGAEWPGGIFGISGIAGLISVFLRESRKKTK